MRSQDETEEEKTKNCEYLNEIRANFTACCDYPVLVIWRWQYNFCVQECEEAGRPYERCCTLPCSFRLLGVMTVIRNDDGSVAQVDVNPGGLVHSFLLSVGNDSQWIPVLSASTTRCYSQFSETSNGYECDVIPKNLFSVIDCSYNENYLKCPPWNPANLKECEFTYKFVQKCLA